MCTIPDLLAQDWVAETTYKQGGTCGQRRRHKQQQSSTGACGPLAIPLQPLPPQPTSLPTCSPADTPHCPPHPASCSSATICCVDKRGAREGPRGKMRGRQARDMAGLGQRTGVGGRARCISNCGGCQSCHVARGRRVPRRSRPLRGQYQCSCRHRHVDWSWRLVVPLLSWCS